jgi:hypothetical protein
MTALGGIIDFMTDLGFELDVINGVVAALDDGREAVADVRHVDPVSQISFGDLPEGLALAEHTSLARDKVRDALLDMMAGLAEYRDALTKLVGDTSLVEDDTVTSFTKLQAGEACIVTPSFSAPSHCTPTTSEG